MTQEIKFDLDGEFIELYKLLKLEGVAQTGGMAKIMIEQQQVRVNNQTETRKRRKIVRGDCVQISELSIMVK